MAYSILNKIANRQLINIKCEVTKEEAAWESFSEEEAQLQKEKTPASTASSVGKGKKGMAKGGKGNIMNFFGKK